eukprot:11039092-Lingulodinium_polyedra.AAC.1
MPVAPDNTWPDATKQTWADCLFWTTWAGSWAATLARCCCPFSCGSALGAEKKRAWRWHRHS